MKIEDVVERPTIYVLIGLPGSGKSTWTRKQLNDGKDYVVVSSDDIIEELGAKDGLNYSEAFKLYSGQATGMMKQRARDALSSGKNVIWDQTNMSKKKRRGILQQVPNNYIKIAVDFDVDDKELFRRLEDRANKTGKRIPRDVVMSMAQSYEPPTRDEGFDKVIKM